MADAQSSATHPTPSPMMAHVSFGLDPFSITLPLSPDRGGMNCLNSRQNKGKWDDKGKQCWRRLWDFYTQSQTTHDRLTLWQTNFQRTT